MKHFQFRPSHWFSVLILGLLVFILNRPDKSTTPHSADNAGSVVTAYRVVRDEQDEWLEPFTVRLPAKTEPMSGALSVMTRLKREESPFPPGTRVLSVTLRDNGVAWADFNRALVVNFPGGSTRESLIVRAIFGTLGQFPAVRAVKITVEGKSIESIGGHLDLSEPQPVPHQNENTAKQAIHF